MTTATPSGAGRVQRLDLPGDKRTWTVLGADHGVVATAEEYLEYLRVQRSSPNTVKSYARALALWWTYLGVFGLWWDALSCYDYHQLNGVDVGRDLHRITHGRSRYKPLLEHIPAAGGVAGP